MKRNLLLLIILMFLAFVPLSHATSITVDQIIWQPDSGFDGSDLSVAVNFDYIENQQGIIDPDSFLITLTNTSGDLVPDEFSSVLLTGIGFTLPLDYHGYIVGGGIDGTTSDGASLSGTWGYDNYSLHSGPFLNVTTASVDTVISTMESSTDTGFVEDGKFQGPNYGILDIGQGTVGGLPHIEGPAFITVNLSQPVGDLSQPVGDNEIAWNNFFLAIDSNSNTVVCSFGSPTAVVPEPATMLLFGSGLIGLAAFGRKKFLKRG